MSGAIDPSRAIREDLRELGNPENSVNVDVGTRGASVAYERVVDGDRMSGSRTSVGGEAGVDFHGRPRGAVSTTTYISMIPYPLARALYSPELAGSLRYDYTFGEGGRVGGRLGMNNTIATHVNVGLYVGIDRGVSGDRKGSWGAEVGFSTGINF